MPAKAPPSGQKTINALQKLGRQIRAHRKAYKVSTVGAAEAAGISRTTLSRIEKGEPSVTMGAYLNVILSLGLELKIVDAISATKKQTLSKDSKIKISDYPQLKKLAWQLKDTKTLSPKETLNLYERNWKHINLKELTEDEREFITQLLTLFGKERLLV